MEQKNNRPPNGDQKRPRPAQGGGRNQQNNRGGNQRSGSGQPRPKLQATTSSSRSASRGEAIRAQKRAQNDAESIVNKYLTAENGNSDKPRRANYLDTGTPTLKVIGIGGMDGGGSKNCILEIGRAHV